MLETFTDDERSIIVRCIEIILEGEWVSLRELPNIIGVNEGKLRQVIRAIPLLTCPVVDYNKIQETFDLSYHEIRCAIGNSLSQVRAISRLPEWVLRRYGITPSEVIAVYDKWKGLRNCM